MIRDIAVRAKAHPQEVRANSSARAYTHPLLSSIKKLKHPALPHSRHASKGSIKRERSPVYRHQKAKSSKANGPKRRKMG